MANEITVGVSLRAVKNGAEIAVGYQKTFDMDGADMGHATQDIGTSAETLDFGDVTGAPGVVLVRNLDGTNFVDLALDSGMVQKFARLRPGHFTLWQPVEAAVYAKADTAACRVMLTPVEA